MCTLGSEYVPIARQRPLTLAQSRQPVTIGSPRQIARGRSPYRQSTQGLNMVYIFRLKLVFKIYLSSWLLFLSIRSFEWRLTSLLKFQVGRVSLFGRQRSRSRSRSRSRTHNTTASDSSGDVDDRSFSEVMYSLSGNLGTGRTLNERFSY